ncbi:MAG TPA: hypothetical protein VF631_10325 [Allosphingosinicella sp.]|jgi:hypothetical protein|uniref:hypothetical protein n=1 Tax=Allosphingosinicella sp. TaxID=2823234 RepID=UPI002F283D7F
MKFALHLLAACWLTFAAGAFAHPPRGIAVAPDGRVFFSDLERIWAIAPGKQPLVVRRSVGAHVHELFLDSGGHLWGEDSFYDPATARYRAGLWMIAPDGRFSYTYGPTGSPTFGAGVLRDRFGCSYLVGETRVRALLLHRLCPGGAPQLLSDRAAARDAEPPVLLSNIGGAAFGPDGSFFFRHRGIVQRLRAGDRLVTAAVGFAPENYGIAVDRAGALYVAEQANRRIVRVDARGRRSAPIGAEAPWAPTGVVASGGALYVLEVTDYARGAPTRLRVRRMLPNGQVQLLGTVTGG